MTALRNGPEVVNPLTRFTWHAACSGKKQYPNGAQAFRAAQGLKGGNAMGYRCRFCGGWHVGNLERSAHFKPRERRGQQAMWADIEAAGLDG